MRQKRVVEYYCARRSEARARVRRGGGAVQQVAGIACPCIIIYYYVPCNLLSCVRARVIYIVCKSAGVTRRVRCSGDQSARGLRTAARL